MNDDDPIGDDFIDPSEVQRQERERARQLDDEIRNRAAEELELNIERANELRAGMSHDEWNCPHPVLTLRCKKKRDGSPMYMHQCLVCGNGNGTGQIKYLPGMEFRSSPWDEALAKRFWNERRAKAESKRQEESKIWRARYEAHLASAKWKDLRRRVIERAGGLCEGCRLTRGHEVHHKTYVHLGDEFLFELVLLCVSCHDRMHSQKRQLEPWQTIPFGISE
jgi:5-methylcytosine-specific restriction endonuclease McrA